MGTSKKKKSRTAYKTEIDGDPAQISEPILKETEKETTQITDEELIKLGFPSSFRSTKGQYVEKYQETAKIGQIRPFQQFLNKKMSRARVEIARKKRANIERRSGQK